MPLPTFIVIGTMKGGTTSLNHYLKHHPQAGMTKKKEINFFCKDEIWGKGVNWYKEQFTNTEQAKVFGDVSPRYSKCHSHPLTAKRMHDTVPGAKLIYLVRDPIKRILSHYSHNYSQLQTDLTFSDYLDENIKETGNAVMSSMYWAQLEYYLKYFPKEQIKVVKSEDLLTNRKEALFDIFDYIGIEHYWDDELFNQERNQGSVRARPRPFVSWTRKYPSLFRIVYKLSTTKMRGILSVEFPRPKPTEEQIERLQDIFKPDIRELSKFSGIDFSEWYE